MRIATINGLLLLASLATAPVSTVQATPSPSQTDLLSLGAPSLGDTLSSLSPLIARGKVTAKAGAGQTFADLDSGDRGEWSQSQVVTGGVEPNLISWDETAVVFANGAQTSKSSERHFIWLKYLVLSSIKVVSLKSWANDDEATDSTVPAAQNGIYSGFVLTMDHTSDIIAIEILAKYFPNPSSLKRKRVSTRLFFATKNDAEFAKKLLIHAASICGAKIIP